jgi:hypothetical protein
MFVAKITYGGDSAAFSTYLGGNGNDQATGIAIDNNGRIWICGWTTSTNLPTVAPIQAQSGGESDAFVCCLSNHGDSVLFASYLGGNGNDRAADIAVDAAGNVYVTGSTNSTNFPVFDALIDTLAGTASDVFVCKIKATTRTLRFSTYFGGSGADVASAIALDAEPTICVVGTTDSPDLPLWQPLLDTLQGGIDIFCIGVDSSGQELLWSSYYGGAGDDFAQATALTADGKVIFAGRTYSANFPLLAPLYGACSQCPNQSQGFVVAVGKMSGSLIFSTFLGGQAGDNEVSSVTSDVGGNLLLAGWTSAADFPLTQPLQNQLEGMRDGFVVGLSGDGASASLATFWGGSGNDQAAANVVADGAVIFAGFSDSPDFPLQSPLQSHHGGGLWDGFVTRIDLDDPSSCGDFDASTDINVADVVYFVQYVFGSGGAPLDCRQGDCDCDGGPTIADAVYMISYIFADGAPPCAGCR